ncbi:ribokinase [Pseudonocardia sp. CNS-139]|nr:ribokinase [Pseudonocardia sp. CNS-139]
MAPRVVVVGDAGVDVLVEPAVPAVTGADVPARIRATPGGAGANTAVWLAHLGAEAVLAARVGADGAGRAVATHLLTAGVEPVLAVDGDHPTCTVVVLLGDVGEGERTMLSDRGAASRLVPADLPDLTGADHLHVSGYVLLDPSSRPAGLAALAAARDIGLTTSVDPQAAPALGPDFLGWVKDVDLLLPNAAELAALGGPDAVLAHVGAVAVTDGPRGAQWLEDGLGWAVPAPAVEAVDPTGAGDAFDAGLLVTWLRGASPEEALRAGCAAGAAAVTRRGARPR